MLARGKCLRGPLVLKTVASANESRSQGDHIDLTPVDGNCAKPADYGLVLWATQIAALNNISLASLLLCRRTSDSLNNHHRCCRLRNSNRRCNQRTIGCVELLPGLKQPGLWLEIDSEGASKFLITRPSVQSGEKVPARTAFPANHSLNI